MITVPVPKHLRDQLHLIATGEKQAAMVAKQVHKDEWQRISSWQLERINELTGMDVAIALTSSTDAIIRTLVERAFRDAPTDWANHAAVFAIGGYGRCELNPSSDIDLLILGLGGSIPDWLSEANARLQPMLWDAGFQVGASLRCTNELRSIIDNDYVTATAVLEQRTLIGGQNVADDMRNTLERFRSRRLRQFLAYKLQELDERRHDVGANRLLMEPNLKSNPGGLRDIQLLRNIAYMVYGSRNLMSLREMDAVNWNDVQVLFAANDHLLGVRSLQHFHHGRRQDVFTLPDQVRLAPLLGFEASGQLQAVEHMMRSHYAKTLHVHQSVEVTVARLRALGHLGRRLILIKSKRPLDDQFVVIDGKVFCSDRRFWLRDDVAHRLMRMFRLAQQKNLRVSIELIRTIREHLDLVTPVAATNADDNRLLLAIFGHLGRLHGIIQDMHDSGFLGAWIPEWGKLTCLMQFDSYHHYTVDEHTLKSLDFLDKVVNDKHPGLPGMTAMLKRTQGYHHLLAFGLLLHDVGKFMGSGHVQRGAMMVPPIARRMQMTREEEEILHFLVEQHVRLSDASRMRDINDPKLLADLIEDIVTPKRLDLLASLTWCDAKAVGEGVLQGYQEAVIADLVEAIRETMAQGAAKDYQSRRDRVIGELEHVGLTHDLAEAWLDRLPDGYSYQVRPQTAVLHHRVVVEAISTGHLACERHRQGAVTTITSASPDRPALIADLAAACTGHAFDIVAARSWVTGDDMVLHEFRLASTIAGRLEDEEAWGRLERDLRLAAAREISSEQLIAKRRQMMVLNGPADSGFSEIDIDVAQDLSQTATVVDIRVKDDVGLLSELCRVIADAGATIEYASVSTFGDVARDTFYISKDERKLSHSDASSLSRKLEAMLKELTVASAS